NMQIATSKRTVTVERVTREDQDCLDLDGADYLAVVTGQTFNFQGEMFEFTQSKHRPDYFSFFTVARREI
ncbi:MAG: UTRA domain-containing protein, partial [Atopobiaceae bacterium]|nr:UTRA domain-containing protein [Atopobiaceae bacterium]